LKILVYEYVSGGGYAGRPLNLSVLSEGYGMLRCLTADLKAAGHEVTVLLDARISTLNPPMATDCIIPVFRDGEVEKFLASAAKINDAVYIIAPETGQTLESLVLFAGQMGSASLNCEAGAICRVADKTILHQTLRESGLCTPKTLVFDAGVDLDIVRSAIKSKLTYPLIFKPVDGVSCGGLSVVKEEEQIGTAIAKIMSETFGKRFVVQEFVKGEAVSVSLLCTDKESLAISLNKQNLQLAQPEATSSYVGGAVPFDHVLKYESFETAEKVAGSFSGLRGYVGVDLVIGENTIYVMDVNPRLTTSYIGLRRVAGFNVAEAMVNAVLKGKLHTLPKYNGFACFSKIESSKPSVNVFQKTARTIGVVSPPFPLSDNAKSISIAAGYGESIAKAKLGLEEAKKRLLNIISRGK